MTLRNVCRIAPLAVLSLTLMADSALAGRGGLCSKTAKLQLGACKAELTDDILSASAICLNVSDPDERASCLREANAERRDFSALCRLQFTARREVCKLVGEDRYDPDFDPANFESDFNNLGTTNPYFPLTLGGTWAYDAGDETNVVTVLNETKDVEGVTCIVVNDLVTGEESSEDTDDWYAQATNGDIHYCGEEVKDFENFEGDNPILPELVSIDGSFKHGRDGDRTGILFLGTPTVDAAYRQEVSIGNAEDVAQVISTTYGFGQDPELDMLVPQALAEQYCPNNDCVVTRDFTPLEPEANERKYYSPGVGVFLEVNSTEESINQLVGCNVDAKCSPLP